MTYLDPILDAMHHQDQLDADTNAYWQSFQLNELEFIRACNKGDANALAKWAPSVRDFNSTNKINVVGYYPTRYETVAEVLDGTLDWGNGPTKTQLFQLLLNVANGLQSQEAAKVLLSEMAHQYARNTTQS